MSMPSAKIPRDLTLVLAELVIQEMGKLALVNVIYLFNYTSEFQFRQEFIV